MTEELQTLTAANDYFQQHTIPELQRYNQQVAKKF